MWRSEIIVTLLFPAGSNVYHTKQASRRLVTGPDAAAPHFTTGRHSSSLPGQLVAAYDQGRQDPTLLSLREEMALTDAMIAKRLRQLADDSPESVYWRVFRRVGTLIDQKRRLVEAEVRHIVLARELLTAEEALALMREVIAIVGRNLPDPQDRASFVEEMHMLMNNGPETPLGAHRYG
jgi:hypothetical protein